MNERKCSRCGVTYIGEGVFRRDTSARRWMVCKCCVQTARDEKKARNRALVKAKDARGYRAVKAMRAGLVTSRKDFAERFGWDLDRMVHDIRHVFADGCPYCGKPLASMAYGQADFTVDIVNPVALPHYSNTRWACRSCNQQKQHVRPELLDAFVSAWERRRNRPPPPWGTGFSRHSLRPEKRSRARRLRSRHRGSGGETDRNLPQVRPDVRR